MKSFISFLRENKKVFPKTVALLGGSYKPPHAGHWHMVLEYLKMADNNRIEVIAGEGVI